MPLRLRPVAVKDAEALLSIYAFYVRTTAISFETEPPSLKEFTERIITVSAAFPYIVADNDGEVLGFAYATAFKPRAAYFPSVETTVYLRHDSRSRGVGQLLYRTLLDLLRLCGSYTAIAGIALPNPASERLHRAVGFEIIGVQKNIGFKLGRWHDVAQVRA